MRGDERGEDVRAASVTVHEDGGGCSFGAGGGTLMIESALPLQLDTIF
jgi:hypothetical protein